MSEPFSEEPSNPWDLQTQCQGGAFRATKPHRLPGTEILTLDKGHPPAGPKATWAETWSLRQSLVALLLSEGDRLITSAGIVSDG